MVTANSELISGLRTAVNAERSSLWVHRGVVVILFMWVSACLNVLREYERAVIFRLGRLQKPDKGPGADLYPLAD